MTIISVVVVARHTAAIEQFDHPLWSLTTSSLVTMGPSRGGEGEVGRAEGAEVQYKMYLISEKQKLLLT